MCPWSLHSTAYLTLITIWSLWHKSSNNVTYKNTLSSLSFKHTVKRSFFEPLEALRFSKTFSFSQEYLREMAQDGKGLCPRKHAQWSDEVTKTWTAWVPKELTQHAVWMALPLCTLTRIRPWLNQQGARHPCSWFSMSQEVTHLLCPEGASLALATITAAQLGDIRSLETSRR